MATKTKQEKAFEKLEEIYANFLAFCIKRHESLDAGVRRHVTVTEQDIERLDAETVIAPQKNGEREAVKYFKRYKTEEIPFLHENFLNVQFRDQPDALKYLQEFRDKKFPSKFAEKESEVDGDEEKSGGRKVRAPSPDLNGDKPWKVRAGRSAEIGRR